MPKRVIDKNQVFYFCNQTGRTVGDLQEADSGFPFINSVFFETVVSIFIFAKISCMDFTLSLSLILSLSMFVKSVLVFENAASTHSGGKRSRLFKMSIVNGFSSLEFKRFFSLFIVS